MPIRIKPYSDFIILDPVEESRVTEMGLDIPDNADKMKPRVGKVIEVGPAVLCCKVDDVVVFSPFTGERLGLQVSPIDYKEYHIIREDALIGEYISFTDIDNEHAA